MYRISIQLKLGISLELSKLLRENEFSKFTYNEHTGEFNSRGQEEIIPLENRCGIQQVYIYNGDTLPEAMCQILKRLEGEDKKAVINYGIEYTTT